MDYPMIPFDIAEMDTEHREFAWGGEIVTFDYPITPRENYIRHMNNQAVWQVNILDTVIFAPALIADNVARGMVWEAREIPMEQFGGKDMFGIEWEYVPDAMGSTVRPGKPALADANDWKEVIKFPDVDSWDWEGMAAENRPLLESQQNLPVQFTILTGYYERLISFMDFENAAMAMIDEDQMDAVKELFEALTDLYIKIIDKLDHYFPGLIHEINVHDDWGHQRGLFFSEATVREMIYPAMKRLVDHIHSKGYFSMFHCCGLVDRLVPVMLDLGWQSWDAMDICDIPTIYEKYGDRLKVTVSPVTPPPGSSKEEYEKYATAFAEQYCRRGKGCLISRWYDPLDGDSQSAIYKASRIAYSREE